MFYYACAFFLTSFAINKYKYQIADYILYQYAKCNKIKRTSDYDVTQCKIYNKNNNLIKVSTKLINYESAVELCKNNFGYAEICYQLLGKKYKIYYDNEYIFPPYPNLIKIKDGYKYKFLSAIYENTDVTDEINQLLGPKNNFYSDIGIIMKTRFITDKNIKCMDNNVNDFVLNDIFSIYEDNSHED